MKNRYNTLFHQYHASSTNLIHYNGVGSSHSYAKVIKIMKKDLQPLRNN